MNYKIPGTRCRIVNNENGLKVSIIESGYESFNKKDCIILLHGFPELSYSYRKLFVPLANNGYYVVAPDQRGYGNTKGWEKNIDNLGNFNILNLAKDIIGLIRNLNIKTNINIVGHDFGSFVAAYSYLLEPKLFKTICLMSAPFSGPPNISEEDEISSLEKMNIKLNKLIPAKKHYQMYFSSKEANKDIMLCSQGLSSFFRSYFHFKSYDWKLNKPFKLAAWSPEELIKMPRYYIMDMNKGMPETVLDHQPTKTEVEICKWLTKEDLNVYCKRFAHTEFQGALNWYKCMTEQQQILKIKNEKLHDKISIPSCFIAGEADWGIYQKPGDLEKMKNYTLSNLKDTFIIEKAGHWVQQEQPEIVANKLTNFIKKFS